MVVAVPLFIVVFVLAVMVTMMVLVVRAAERMIVLIPFSMIRMTVAGRLWFETVGLCARTHRDISWMFRGYFK